MTTPVSPKATCSLRVGDGWNPDAPLPTRGRSETLQPPHAGFAKAFGIGHQVGLRHRHHIFGAEEFADLDLMLQGLLRNRAGLAGEDVALFIVEFHRGQSILMPPSCTALAHFASSLC